MVTAKSAKSACLVTGAAGFIGSHLVDRLLAQGHQVIGIDDFSLGRRVNLAKALQDKQFTLLKLDVNNLPRCVAAVRAAGKGRIKTVWHMAANSDIRAGVRDPNVDLQRTFLTTYNTLLLMEQLRISELVFASTSAIYGELDVELREDSGPLFPVSNYGAMKLASEAAISAALEKFLERACICRFPNVVGSRATHGVIYDFLQKLRANPKALEVLGDGSQKKPYLHVSELVDAMMFVHRRAKGRLCCYNIAPSSGSTTVRHIAQATVRAFAPGAAIRYTGGSRGWVGDVPRFRYSIKKLKALGWVSRLSSDDAVKLAIRENAQEIRASSDKN